MAPIHSSAKTSRRPIQPRDKIYGCASCPGTHFDRVKIGKVKRKMSLERHVRETHPEVQEFSALKVERGYKVRSGLRVGGRKESEEVVKGEGSGGVALSERGVEVEMEDLRRVERSVKGEEGAVEGVLEGPVGKFEFGVDLDPALLEPVPETGEFPWWSVEFVE